MTDPGFKCGAVAVVGKPNVGKSTLMNFILGEKLAIVSPRPQTTRGNMAGIFQDAESQIVFYDTPGIHAPKNDLAHYMLKQVQEALDGSEMALFLIDPVDGIHDEEKIAAEWLKHYHHPVWVVVNKVDLVAPERIEKLLLQIKEELGPWPILQISASVGTGVPELLAEIKKLLPVQPPLFPEDQMTDKNVRDLAAEMVREQCFLQLKQEIPYGVAVVIEKFEEKEAPEPIVITATIHVEKENHKGILIGAGGQQLKMLGQAARERIEAVLERKVFLQLWIKVAKNWRKDPDMMKRLGYDTKQK